MYSLVMMAAFATGADATPALVAAPTADIVLTSCNGCCGYVTSCTGCCGYSSCYGGYSHGWGRKWHGHKHGCISYGCCGFNWGPAYSYGCCGWSYSCFGYGGCYGGCCGGCYGSWSYGCGYIAPYGAYIIGGGGVIVAPATVTPPAVATPPAAAPVPPPIADKKDAANIKFVLPAGAKLYVDGRLTNGAGEERPFYTPNLVPGRKFYYDARAEMVVNGETVVEEKRVIVQAGDDLRESFPKLIAAAAPAADTTLATK